MVDIGSFFRIFRESYRNKNKKNLDKLFMELEEDYKEFTKKQEEIERRFEVAKKGKRYKLL